MAAFQNGVLRNSFLAIEWIIFVLGTYSRYLFVDMAVLSMAFEGETIKRG